MMLDDHNACPACPDVVRDVYAAARRVLEGDLRTTTPDHEELHLVVERLRPFVEAHHANQLHAFSKELEDARHPKFAEVA